MKTVTRILTGADLAKTNGAASMREYWRKMTKHGYDTPFIDSPPAGVPVQAFVDFGRWIARCECGGAEAVDYADPVFYCCSCGNEETGGKPRPVIFPANRTEIEGLLMARPVYSTRGRNAFEQATNSQPLVIDAERALSRSWTPDETVEDLKEQNKHIKKGGK